MNAHFKTMQGLYDALSKGDVTADDICYVDENGGVYTHGKWYGLPEPTSGGGVPSSIMA